MVQDCCPVMESCFIVSVRSLLLNTGIEIKPELEKPLGHEESQLWIGDLMTRFDTSKALNNHVEILFIRSDRAGLSHESIKKRVTFL